MMAHGHFDASVSSLVAPESGAAAPEVMSPDIVGKRCGRKSSELNTLEKIKEPRKNSTPGGSYQHCSGQKKKSLYRWCAAAFSAAWQKLAPYSRKHCKCPIDNDLRNLLTKPVGIKIDWCMHWGNPVETNQKPKKINQNWIITWISASCVLGAC